MCWHSAEGRPDLLEPIVDGLPYIGAEVVYAAREEMACTLDDVLAAARGPRSSAPRRPWRPRRPSPPSSQPDMEWGDAEVHEQAARFVDACQKELLTAGLDLP